MGFVCGETDAENVTICVFAIEAKYLAAVDIRGVTSSQGEANGKYRSAPNHT